MRDQPQSRPDLSATKPSYHPICPERAQVDHRFRTQGACSYLEELGEIAQRALKEMRLLVQELRPPALEQEGLVGALQLLPNFERSQVAVAVQNLVSGGNTHYRLRSACVTMTIAGRADLVSPIWERRPGGCPRN